MHAGQVKGSLLEYIVRGLMVNCGFTSVKPDGHYIVAQNGTGLFFINGKGAAHDADVLMEPPIQMPFSYPSRLLFECKSYDKSIGLDVIRNALGLRYDINEFEIVTDQTIAQRKNNLRDNYAISNRKRYNYQVGVASIEPFGKGAFEFAANNKIPLLSLRWIFNNSTCQLFHRINKIYLDQIPDAILDRLYQYLKDKDPDAETKEIYNDVHRFLEEDQIIGIILSAYRDILGKCLVGLLESGDLIFLFSEQDEIRNFFLERSRSNNLEARLKFTGEERLKWSMVIDNFYDDNPSPFTLKFNVPVALIDRWKAFDFDRFAAYNLKREYFSRVFIFSQRANGYGLPFTVINLDSRWLAGLGGIEE